MFIIEFKRIFQVNCQYVVIRHKLLSMIYFFTYIIVISASNYNINMKAIDVQC